MLRHFVDRLTYANVAATLALFISLGGASYAVVALPEHSVGGRQLKPGAVTVGALGFPLGVTGITDHNVQDIYRDQCSNEPEPPGECAVPPCYLPRAYKVLTPGRELHLDLKAASRLLISAVVGLHDESPAGAPAEVTCAFVFDHRPPAPSSSKLTIVGGQVTQVPVQTLFNASAGPLTVGLEVTAQYTTYAVGDVLVYPVTLDAVALPPV